MKESIHPTLYKIEVTCTTCGNKFTTTSTSKSLKVDSCSNCHPFYTGEGFSSTKDGRIDKFNKKFAKKEAKPKK